MDLSLHWTKTSDDAYSSCSKYSNLSKMKSFSYSDSKSALERGLKPGLEPGLEREVEQEVEQEVVFLWGRLEALLG